MQALSYSRYYYSAPLSDDAYYSGMSDIDWSKRSAGYDNWISPAYGFSSMADHDWGWKKRSGDDSNQEAEEEEDEAEEGGDDDVALAVASPSRSRYGNFFNSYDPYRWQRYYRPYQPPKASAPSTSSHVRRSPIALASRSYGASSYRSNPVRDNSYNYVGMADMDWGWKKRKR